MSDAWDSYAGEATQSAGGDWPLVPDDIYDAEIVSVGEPYEKDTQFGHKTKFAVTWKLTGGDLEQPEELPQFLTIPDGLINKGFIGSKSTVFKVMQALGYDMEDSVRFDPRDWIGKKARVDVENSKNQDGEETSWITNVKPPRQRRDAAAASGRKKQSNWTEDDE